MSQPASTTAVYQDGTYLLGNPDWHAHESAWKADQILNILGRNAIAPKTICDVGCGAGEVLRQLQIRMSAHCELIGYEMSQVAFDLCRNKANAHLQFVLGDISETRDYFDLILVLDVLEHVENYYELLRSIRSRGEFKIFHFPLDLSVQTVMRKKALNRIRDMYYHIHYFSKDTALRALKDAGYETLDWIYTPRRIVFSSGLRDFLVNQARKLFFVVSPDLGVRVLGGYSLLVLTT